MAAAGSRAPTGIHSDNKQYLDGRGAELVDQDTQGLGSAGLTLTGRDGSRSRARTAGARPRAHECGIARVGLGELQGQLVDRGLVAVADTYGLSLAIPFFYLNVNMPDRLDDKLARLERYWCVRFQYWPVLTPLPRPSGQAATDLLVEKLHH